MAPARNRRATLSPWENFYRHATEEPIQLWQPCGAPAVRSIWEELAGHALSQERAREFFLRSEVHQLAKMDADDVRQAAASAISENSQSHLLLTQWADAALALALVRFQSARQQAEHDAREAREERRRLRRTAEKAEAELIARQQRAASLRERNEEKRA